MTARTLVNGQTDSGLPVDDRGLAYGDGLFETIAWREGAPRFWPDHLARLSAGCERLGIPRPADGLLEQEIDQVCSGLDSATVKVTWTRGGGPRGYLPPEHSEPNRIVTATATETEGSSGKEGIRVDWSDNPLGEEPRLAGLKHLNRLPQVLARAESRDRNLDEILCSLADGTVIGGSMSNLFVLIDGVWLTPETSRAGIAGCMRGAVLRTLGPGAQVSSIDTNAVAQADALVMTSSLTGVRPVSQLGDRHLSRHPRCDELLSRMTEEGVSECADWL